MFLLDLKFSVEFETCENSTVIMLRPVLSRFIFISYFK